MYGDMSGIFGASLPANEKIELPAREPPNEDFPEGN